MGSRGTLLPGWRGRDGHGQPGCPRRLLPPAAKRETCGTPQRRYLALGGGDAGLELAQRAEVVQLKVGVDLEGKGHLGEVPPHTVHGEQHGPGPTQLGSARPGRGGGGGGGGGGLAGAAGGRRGTARPLARGSSPSHTLTDSLAPRPHSRARPPPPACESVCLPACLPRLPPSAPAARSPAPPQRAAVKPASLARPSRCGGPGRRF